MTRLSVRAALTALLIMEAATSARDVVEIRLRGYFYAAPATVRIIVAVEPDAHNRKLLIEADGERMFRSTEITLEGASGQRLHTIEFKNLEAGNYTLRAVVQSTTDVLGSTEQHLTVEGRPD